MLISIFLIAATVMLLYIAFAWSSSDFVNVMAKMSFFFVALIGIVCIVGHFGLLALV